MFKLTLIAAVLALSVCSVSEAQAEGCSMYMNFETSVEAQAWRAVNDGVMGGLSSGGPSFENGNMIFEGVINTNGGGFSSVRVPMQPGALSDASGMKLRLRSDGRAYKMTFRTNAGWRGRRISFQTPMPRTNAGEWAEISVPFSELRGSIFGRAVRGAEFDRNEVVEMGIILADGRDGSFKLEVDWIADCPLETPS